MTEPPSHLLLLRNPPPEAFTPSPPPKRPKRPEFERVVGAPPMCRRNGIGFKLLGRIGDPAIEPARVKVLWFTFLFVPVLPIHAYAVEGDWGGYCFRGGMSLFGFVRRYRWRIFPFLLTVFVEALLSAAFVLTVTVAAAMLVAWLFGRL